jgi:hypothetical protein
MYCDTLPGSFLPQTNYMPNRLYKSSKFLTATYVCEIVK